MDAKPQISFEDTAVAFSYKTDAALRKANFIFSLVNHPWISGLATGAVKLGLQLRLPIEALIKKTAFDHFCGGESIEKSEEAIKKLAAFGVGTILDYSVEGEDSEADFDHTMEEILLTIEKASTSQNIPFSVFKVTGIGSFSILEKIQNRESLDPQQQKAWENLQARVDTICKKAHLHSVAVLIDAEETWIQTSIDALAYNMMQKYNREKAIVFNTYQLYRTDSLANLFMAHHNAMSHSYFLGAKIVRGAYMEKERDRAEAMNYPSPIHPTKETTDAAFNEALAFCISHHDKISVMCGSHNEYSNLYLTELMEKKGLLPRDPKIWFAQLYGMSDNISFNLAKADYNVVKYVPYGPVRSVMPYLFRRAAENTSVAGQSSRELTLIRKELKRRKLKN
jgi:proline dehydrogenase